ncbi:MAG: hypothetical protein WD733_23210 [Bryobacterales bacterium]
MSAGATRLHREADNAASAWLSVLAQVPTVFGKLLWVASFRSAGSNRYWHPALGYMFSPEVTSRVLEESHRQHFDIWLNMGLQKQYDDFAEYIGILRFIEHPKDFLQNVGPKLIPPSAIEPQQLPFDTDLAVVLELLD